MPQKTCNDVSIGQEKCHLLTHKSDLPNQVYVDLLIHQETSSFIVKIDPMIFYLADQV